MIHTHLDGAMKEQESCVLHEKHLLGTSHKETGSLLTGDMFMFVYENDFLQDSCIREQG